MWRDQKQACHCSKGKRKKGEEHRAAGEEAVAVLEAMEEGNRKGKTRTEGALEGAEKEAHQSAKGRVDSQAQKAKGEKAEQLLQESLQAC